MRKFKVTRTQMSEIYDIACIDWAKRISDMVNDIFGTFGLEAELDENIVASMFDAATKEQKPVLQSIFPDYVINKNTFIYTGKQTKNKVDAFGKEIFGSDYVIELLDTQAPEQKYKNAGFYVYPGYKVTTGKTSNNGTYIIIEKK